MLQFFLRICENFLIISNGESGEKTVDFHQTIFMQKAFVRRNLFIIISITILARFLTSTFCGEIKMIVMMRHENEKFIQHWKRSFHRKETKKGRMKFKKEKKAPKTSCFPLTCARAVN
jgi:hypothetical protein